MFKVYTVDNDRSLTIACSYAAICSRIYSMSIFAIASLVTSLSLIFVWFLIFFSTDTPMFYMLETIVLMQSSCLLISKFRTHGYLPSMCLHTNVTRSGLPRFLLSLSMLINVAHASRVPIFFAFFLGSSNKKAD